MQMRVLSIVEKINLRMECLKVMLVIDEDAARQSHQMSKSFSASTTICHPNKDVHVAEPITQCLIQETYT